MTHDPSVLIIGLGYVGLPVVAHIAGSTSFSVMGFDLNATKITTIQAGKADWIDFHSQSLLDANPKQLTFTAQEEELKQYDIALIAVPTPVDAEQLPDLQAVESATKLAAAHLRPDGLLILESTVNPGVCDEVLRPLLNSVQRHDIRLAHCPERVDPGNSQYTLTYIPRVLGAQDDDTLAEALTFYQSFIQAPITTVSSLQTAEASKIVENAFRDINIAFVNELAQSFAHFDQLDIVEVIDAAATKPFGFLAHYPGAGVGGHCIPVDPYYLISSAKERGFEHSFLRLARQINRSMPAYVVGLLEKEFPDRGSNPPQGKITLIGLSYKPGIADLRNSPALEIRRLLEERYPQLTVYDPLVPEHSTVNSLSEALTDAETVVIATAHPEIVTALQQKKWPKLKLIIDGRNCLKKDQLPSHVTYRGIGR